MYINQTNKQFLHYFGNFQLEF